MKVITHCSLCQSTDLKCLWDLPQLPLSETYGTFDASFKHYDQALLYCNSCGHVQLQHQLPTPLLYADDNYHFSTAKSNSTSVRLASFVEFVNSSIDTDVNKVIDVGGNDDSLLTLIAAKEKYLIDPSLKQQGRENDINYVKEFVEQVDIKSINPDLIVSCHTLEHIAQPAQFLKKLLSNLSEQATLVFEVPCFVEQIKNGRLEAVFHQHYHYFHAKTLVNVIQGSGGEVIALDYNAYPTCGGALMVAFKKMTVGKVKRAGINDFLAYLPIDSLFNQQLLRFQALNQRIAAWIASKECVVGYGASLLLPVIFYHIGDASKKICLICDDDPNKYGLTYKNVEGISVCSSQILLEKVDAAIFISTYENIAKLSQIIEEKFPNRQFTEFLNE